MLFNGLSLNFFKKIMFCVCAHGRVHAMAWMSVQLVEVDSLLSPFEAHGSSSGCYFHYMVPENEPN